MASVTGYTAERMQTIEDTTVVDGDIVGGHLILLRRDGITIDAGSVIGPTGPIGPSGAVSIVICTSATRPAAPDRFEGLYIYETDTDRTWVWDGVAWVYRGGKVFCTSVTRPASPFNGLEIYETDTKRTYQYDGAAWRYIFNAGGTSPLSARAFAGVPVTTISGWKKITLSNESYDYGNNMVNGTFTCPETRMYDVRGRTSLTIMNDGDRLITAIYVNGAERTRGIDIICAVDTTSIGSAVSDRLVLSAGDDVELWMYCSVAGRSTDTGSALTFLGVHGV